ncbi:MAG: flagellar basal-body rod protein FlgG [Myxococcales bacterium]|nr:flagellar basal-body rod protein FlgG [Myxococcales bacterium]
MLRSLYTAATGMEAQQFQMDTIANNLANVSTTGFKRNRAQFEDLLSETLQPAGAPTLQGGGRPSPLQVGLGVRTVSSTRSFSQGDMVTTNNPLDLAVMGDGFFRVQRTNGELAYSRAGNFRIDSAGRLSTQAGELVDPGITVPQDATEITARPEGIVTAKVAGREEPLELGTLELVMFSNPEGLEAIGGNLLRSTVASGVPIMVRPGEQGAGTILQGFTEGSNVKAVEEMIGLISTQRSYELNSKVISTADQMLQRLTNLR